MKHQITVRYEVPKEELAPGADLHGLEEKIGLELKALEKRNPGSTLNTKKENPDKDKQPILASIIIWVFTHLIQGVELAKFAVEVTLVIVSISHLVAMFIKKPKTGVVIVVIDSHEIGLPATREEIEKAVKEALAKPK